MAVFKSFFICISQADGFSYQLAVTSCQGSGHQETHLVSFALLSVAPELHLLRYTQDKSQDGI